MLNKVSKKAYASRQDDNSKIYMCPMFIAALFTITRYRNNLNKWIKKMHYVYIQWNTTWP